MTNTAEYAIAFLRALPGSARLEPMNPRTDGARGRLPSRRLESVAVIVQHDLCCRSCAPQRSEAPRLPPRHHGRPGTPVEPDAVRARRPRGHCLGGRARPRRIDGKDLMVLPTRADDGAAERRAAEHEALVCNNIQMVATAGLTEDDRLLDLPALLPHLTGSCSWAPSVHAGAR